MRAEALLKRFKDQRVLVLGDLILDCYIWGKVTRISPEAPVPVVDVVRQTYTLGGASNVASNIVALKGQATVIGIVGKDFASETMRTLFAERGIEFASIEDKRPTTLKTRVIAHSQQVVRFDHESTEKLSGKSLALLTERVREAVRTHDAVIVSDYKKGVVSGELIKTVVKAAGKKFVALDPKVGHFHLYKGVSLITPNLMEAAQGSGMEIKDEASLLKAGRKLQSMLRGKSVLITRGEDGMSLFHENRVIHIPTVAKHVYDVTGAGDTVIAVYTMAQAAGATPEEAALLSNHAAGIVVAEVGTAQATQEKILDSLRTNLLTPRVQRLK